MDEEKSIEEEIKIKAQKERKLARYMSSTSDLVEEQIRKAREKGEFDELPGAGKPIDLYENPFEPPELRMAFKILKDNNMAPFWIELGNEIDNNLAKLWKEVEDFKKYSYSFYKEKYGEIAVKRFEKKKRSFYYEKSLELDKIRKKIIDYNLQCPTFKLGRPNIEVEKEMEKIVSEIEELIKDTVAKNK